MLKVGVTGGLASGKTFVADALAEWGCMVIHADQLGHEVLAPGGEAFDAVVRAFGPDVTDATGAIDRKALAARVFGNPARLEVLNSLVHPPVWARAERMMGEFAQRQPGGIAVVEAAILIETGSYRRFDKMILVMCDEQQQVRRAVKRGVSEAEALARLRSQMPAAEKRKYADFVIDTSGEKTETLEQTRRVWEALRRITQ